jgi:4-hydroxybenzoate polyprenyltransferase
MHRAAAVAADGLWTARRPAGSTGGRLARFVLERFPPASTGTLIAALVLCGTAGATLDRGEALRVGWSQAWAAIAAALAFLQLRVLDELRDEAADRVGRPDRPLPRGLVSRAELRALAVGAAVAGAAVAAGLGPAALAWYGLALAQVWLLDIGGDRRPAVLRGMVAAALVHSGIVPTVLLVAWAASATPGASAVLAATLLLVWGAGLALEVARKTFSADEERPGIETYSATLGRSRALALAALFLTVTGAGAALLAIAVGASVPVAVLPLLAAVAASAVLVAGGDRIGTGALGAGVPLAVLAALLWPVALAWGFQ